MRQQKHPCFEQSYTHHYHLTLQQFGIILLKLTDRSSGMLAYRRKTPPKNFYTLKPLETAPDLAKPVVYLPNCKR